jgi:protein farnesyltransferase subunit beta
MPFPIKGGKHRLRHKVQFNRRGNMASPSQTTSQASASSASEQLEDLLSDASETASPIPQNQSNEPVEEERSRGVIIEEIITDDENSASDPWQDIPIPHRDPVISLPPAMSSAPLQIPSIFTSLPAIRDLLQTQTTLLQDETLEDVIPFLNASSDEVALSSYNRYGVASLDRARHIAFLHKSLQDLPGGYTAADAARPWFFYWALCGLRVMGANVSTYAEGLVSTTRAMQNFGGGFGGGHGMMSHLAPSYATTLSLALVAEPIEGETDAEREERMSLVYGAFDRRRMWEWLGDLKGADGGFAMCIGGEVDVRYVHPVSPGSFSRLVHCWKE